MILFAAAFAQAPAGLSGWVALREEDPWVGCTETAGFTWCRSRGRVALSPARIGAILGDFPNYPKVFTRVAELRVLEPDVLHVVLDMPFPLNNRDYIARFSVREEPGVTTYSWKAVTHPKAPPTDNVRLYNSAGDWRLEADGSGTMVSYTWNAEMGGDIPEWALPRARVTQGVEVIQWLRDAR